LEFNTEAVSGILGGLLGAVSLTLPLWLTAIPMACAILVATTLREPKRHKLTEKKNLKAILHASTHALFRHKGLRMVLLTYGLISSLSLMLFWFFQSYQMLVGVPVVIFGLTHAATVIAGALADARTISYALLVNGAIGGNASCRSVSHDAFGLERDSGVVGAEGAAGATDFGASCISFIKNRGKK